MLKSSDLSFKVAPSGWKRMYCFSFMQSLHFLVVGLKSGALSITLHFFVFFISVLNDNLYLEYKLIFIPNDSFYS